MQSENIDQLTKALVEAQKEIKPAIRDAENPFFKSKYADLKSIDDACKAALNKNGLCVVQYAERTEGNNYAMITKILHISGQWMGGSFPLIHKGDMQGMGSAASYARRYGLAAICGVVTDDDDGNSAVREVNSTPPSLEKITEKQAKMVYAKLAAKGYVGADQKEWLMKQGYHFTEDIPYNKLNQVLDSIDKLVMNSKRKHHKDFDQAPEEIPWPESNR